MTAFTGPIHRRIVAALVLVISAFAAPARAQTTTDPATNSRIRFGPFWINPNLTVKNVGVDTNVFNDPENPKQDFTFTLSPMTDIFIRAGLFRADLRIVNEVVYYRRYASERGSNTVYSAVFSGGLTRFSPYLGLDYTNTKERPGFEVDERARHSVFKVRGGGEYRVGTRTSVGVELARTFLSFDGDSTFRGVDLSDQLDRTETVARVTFRQALTPLTRASVGFERQRDRFDVANARDSNATRVTFGLDFEPIALISGGASVGYRRLTFLGDSLEGERGLIASVNLNYTLSSSTKINVGAFRDVQYSYDPIHPYYLLTGVSTTITQRVFGNWDVQLLGGRQRLAYRDEGGRLTETSETDYMTRYGGGVGYRLGRSARIGATFSRNRRTSPDPLRRFNGNQFGTSVTYGT